GTVGPGAILPSVRVAICAKRSLSFTTKQRRCPAPSGAVLHAMPLRSCAGGGLAVWKAPWTVKGRVGLTVGAGMSAAADPRLAARSTAVRPHDWRMGPLLRHRSSQFRWRLCTAVVI